MNKPGDRFRLDRKEKDIAEQMLFARRDPAELGRTVFLIGAGCSVTAGIPAVRAIAQQMVQETVRRFDHVDLSAEDAYKSLLKNELIEEKHDKSDPPSINWHRVYDMMFERYFTTPDDIRELFSGLVTKANGAINWAHLILGELVAQGLVSTVLTTNFDQLALSGMVRAGVIPVVCDGLESLNRISGQPTHPQLIEIHGSRHTYTLRNRPDEVASVGADPKAITAIQTLLQHARTFVVVGYGGREDGVMDLLVQAAKAFPDKHLFWVAHSSVPEDLSDKAREFLNSGTNSAALLGYDADQFFFELSKHLRIGAPSAIARPLDLIERWIADARRSASTNTDILAELKDASEQLDRLQEHLRTREKKSLAAAIRERRLAGDLEGAWRLIETEILLDDDLAGMDDETLSEAARAALDFGGRSPECKVLKRAVAFSRALVERAHSDAQLKADRQNVLGEALGRFGERLGDAETLERAVVVFREALRERTRERMPLKWSMTQNNLGNALSTLGGRESGTARLEEAVAAYRAALEECIRERVPLNWAGMQNNLGNALRALGERESGTARLEEAVAAYRAALEQRTRERVPLDWAATQNNLGAALMTLGERGSDTTQLEEAVGAYREALKERTRERVPLDWAGTQNNLGNALKALGERESGTERLEEAVAAYRGALEECTRERVPLDWAMTQNNLGTVLSTLGERESSTARLEEAVAAYRAALEEWTRERVPLDWALAQNNLGNALLSLGERESGTARLDEAVAAFRAALEEWTRERVPLDWATAQHNLGNALSSLGMRESGTARLDEAVAAYRESLKEWTRERVPIYWAATLGNEGNALRIIAERTSDLALAERALAQIETARREFEAAGHLPNATMFANQAALARALIDRLKARP